MSSLDQGFVWVISMKQFVRYAGSTSLVVPQYRLPICHLQNIRIWYRLFHSLSKPCYFQVNVVDFVHVGLCTATPDGSAVKNRGNNAFEVDISQMVLVKKAHSVQIFQFCIEILYRFFCNVDLAMSRIVLFIFCGAGIRNCDFVLDPFSFTILLQRIRSIFAAIVRPDPFHCWYLLNFVFCGILHQE